MKEAIKSKEKKNSFKDLLNEFKGIAAAKIKQILSYEKPDGRNEFYGEFKNRFDQLSLEEQLGLYYTLDYYLKKWWSSRYPYEELTEKIKPLLEEDETEWAQRVLDLIINKDIFKEDGLEFWSCMSDRIIEKKKKYTGDEKEIINERVLKNLNLYCNY